MKLCKLCMWFPKRQGILIRNASLTLEFVLVDFVTHTHTRMSRFFGFRFFSLNVCHDNFCSEVVWIKAERVYLDKGFPNIMTKSYHTSNPPLDGHICPRCKQIWPSKGDVNFCVAFDKRAQITKFCLVSRPKCWYHLMQTYHGQSRMRINLRFVDRLWK